MESSKDKPLLKSAPPPWHSVAAVVLMLTIFVPFFPSLESIDNYATMEVFTRRVFPDLISLPTLVILRFLCFLLGIAVTIEATFIGNGWEQATNYLPSSKLQSTLIPIRGLRTQLPYTSFSWNLLTLSFGLSTYIAWKGLDQSSVPQWLLRVALIVHEIASPNTLLVSAVVRYGIWQNAIKQGGSTDGLKSPRVLLWHNANAIMACSEVALFGGLPVRLGHVAISPMYGIFYILFSWSMVNFWKPEAGPQFIYFFFDTTLGAFATKALLALLAIMLVFYSIFAGAGYILGSLGGGLIVHILFVVVICGAVCRVRD